MTYRNNQRINDDEAYDLKWKLNLRQYQLSLLFSSPSHNPLSSCISIEGRDGGFHILVLATFIPLSTVLIERLSPICKKSTSISYNAIW